MIKKITVPLTLRITDAEVLDSQLSDNDLGGLNLIAGNGNGNGGGVKCSGGWCAGTYSDEKIQEEPQPGGEPPGAT